MQIWVRSLGWEDPLEKGKVTHSSILAWRIPWTILSLGSQRVGHDWATSLYLVCICCYCSIIVSDSLSPMDCSLPDSSVATISQSLPKFIPSHKYVAVFCCRQVMSNSSQPRGLQHAKFPCPSLPPRVCPGSCSVNQWCHPTISSYVVLFPVCLQSFPASGSFPVSQLFASGGDDKLLHHTRCENPMNWIKRQKGMAPKDEPSGWKGSSMLLRKSEGQLTCTISPKLSCRKASLYIRVQTKSIISKGPSCDFALDGKVI